MSPKPAEHAKENNSIVFVVDDDLSFRRSVERLIRLAGFKVQPFASAREFLSAEIPDLPACLVSDVRMPGLSGLDLQRELTRIGRPRAAFKVRATSESVPPGPIPPSFNGSFAASHSFIFVIPLALVRAQTESSTEGTPMYSNFRPSNSTPLAPKICCKMSPPILLPIVNPSGLAR